MKILIKEGILKEEFVAKLSKKDKLRNPYTYKGRNIQWFGAQGMCVFHKSLVEYHPENIWYGEKLERLEDLIENSEGYVEIECGYGTLHVNNVQDIIEHQESVLTDEFEVNFDGVDEPLSSGDNELDVYLGATDSDLFEEHIEKMELDGFSFLSNPDIIYKLIVKHKGNIKNVNNLLNQYIVTYKEDYDEEDENIKKYFKWIEEAKKQLTYLEKGYNDLKESYDELRVTIRDGNHRVKAAIESGEQWICAEISKEDLSKFSDFINPKYQINFVTQKH